MNLSNLYLTYGLIYGIVRLRWMVRKILAYIALTKPKILVMLVFTSLCAAFVASKGVPDIRLTCWMLAGMSLSAGGAAAFNMWYDRDIDRVMSRTSKRPLPSGQVSAKGAFWFGISLGALSIAVLSVFVNGLTAVFSLLGFVYYAVIYTMWLKRRTPQNIVIGGGAGAVPPLIGWAAVTGHISLAPILMFVIIFLWTPPHFWALALYKNEDYTRAGIPMMPVVRGPRSTKRQSVLYSILLLFSSVTLYFTGTVGTIYLVAAILFGVLFFIFTLCMWREEDNQFVWAKRTFFCSLLYLPAVFAFMVIGMTP